MKRLRLQFVLFFILLAASLGFFAWNSYKQLGREEHELWRAQSERVYNQMQAAISDFLTSEDSRRWSDYRFYGTLRPGLYPKQAIGLSPISKPPIDDARGLIGYFQIDPEGQFSTPYLPEGWPVELDATVHASEGRRELYRRLEDITSSLKPERNPPEGSPKDTAMKTSGFVELGDLKKSAGEILDDLAGKDLLTQGPGFFGGGSVENKPEAEVAEAEDKAMAQGARAKNVYPNPIQEQAVKLEKRKMTVAKKAEEAPPPGPVMAPPATAAPAGAVASSAPAPTLSRSGSAATETPPAKPEPAREPRQSDEIPVMVPASVLADPFQARLVGESHLVFYRKVWADQRQFLQGFVVDLEKFYAWLMDQSFANSELPDFALARLELQGRSLAQYGFVDVPTDNGTHPLFERALGYPLNLFDWRVYATQLPQIGTRWFLNALSVSVALLATIGLYLIYRTAASQVAYSEKRQDFVSAVTHELKTPLTSIRMYSEMLEDGWAKDEDKRKEYYGQISKESGRLARLIDNVLQLARLEKKTYKLNLKKEVPNVDFEAICSEIRKMAERQGFNLNWKSSADLPPLTYDPEAIKQILFTLFDNSLKFGAEASDKNLEASLEKDGDRVIWSWRDRGPGIPEKELKRVFENFYRVENEMTRKTQGTGIGLAMSRMLAQSMGAEIEARNRPEGGLEVRLIFKEAFPAPREG